MRSEPLMAASGAAPVVLALRPREAAKALGIGVRKLWALTKSGAIPHAKIGTCTVYPVDGLRAWLAAQAEKGAQR